MLEVLKLYARSFDLDHIDVFWELADFGGDAQTILRFDFQLFRSESPAGPWEQLTPKFQDQYYYRDVTPALLHKYRNLYYQLRITDRQTNETKEFGPTSQVPEPDLIALEIMRQEDILWREFAGRRCWLFKARTFGVKCICFDRVTGRRLKSNCINCYGVGYLGGFLTPIEAFVQIDPSPNAPTLGTQQEQQHNNTSGRLISFPPTSPKDILIEAENVRWRIVSVTSTQRLRAVVHQELVLHQIEVGDIEYKIDVQVGDLTKLQPASERNFTQRTHVERNKDLNTLLAVYGGVPRGSAR